MKNSRENSLPATDIFQLCYMLYLGYFLFCFLTYLLSFSLLVFIFFSSFVGFLFLFIFYFYFFLSIILSFLLSYLLFFFLSFSLLFFDFRILYLQQIWMIAASTTTFDLVRGLHDGSGKKQNVLFSPILNLYYSPDFVFYLFLHNNHNYFDIILIF